MPHPPRFQKLCDDAKALIREVTPEQAQARQQAGALLIDVREVDEYAQEHAPGAIHLSKGVIEMKIELAAPDPGAEIICYCGGGNRSALVAENLKRMGYTNVFSQAGGFKAWKAEGLPTTDK